jgi:colanic acid biosynthesis glycosyl transferase WcaI
VVVSISTYKELAMASLSVEGQAEHRLDVRKALHILVIVTFYAPDWGAAALLYTMLCENLVRLGHRVTVLCTVPHYPSGQVQPEFRGRLFSRELRNGVEVIRVWVPSGDRAQLFHRLLTFVVYQLLGTAAGIVQSYDVVLGGNPALEVFLPFQVLTVLRRKPAVFTVHDLYPDVGVKLGIFRHRPVVWLIRLLEDLCLKASDYVRVVSEGFAPSLTARGIPASRIKLTFDFTDTDFIKPEPRSNQFAREWGLDQHFVVQYAGNIGFSQGLESVVETARALQVERKILFAFIGDGASRKTLEEAVRREGPENVRFIPFQPRERLPHVLASTDVALISLKRGLSADSVPGKFYSILASGRPLIASVDSSSDTSRLLERANCGICVPPEDPSALKDAILALYRNEGLRLRLGRNGRDYVVANHSCTAAAKQLSNLLTSLVSK